MTMYERCSAMTDTERKNNLDCEETDSDLFGWEDAIEEEQDGHCAAVISQMLEGLIIDTRDWQNMRPEDILFENLTWIKVNKLLKLSSNSIEKLQICAHVSASNWRR